MAAVEVEVARTATHRPQPRLVCRMVQERAVATVPTELAQEVVVSHLQTELREEVVVVQPVNYCLRRQQEVVREAVIRHCPHMAHAAEEVGQVVLHRSRRVRAETAVRTVVEGVDRAAPKPSMALPAPAVRVLL